jgi:hypothetical protein
MTNLPKDWSIEKKPEVKHKIGSCMTPDGNICDVCKAKYEKVVKPWRWLYQQGVASTIQQCVLVLEGMRKEIKPAQSLQDHWGMTETSITRIVDNNINYGFNQAIDEAITKIKELGEGK